MNAQPRMNAHPRMWWILPALMGGIAVPALAAVVEFQIPAELASVDDPDNLLGQVDLAPSCTLDLVLTYSAGTLTMDFFLGTDVPVTWHGWLIAVDNIFPFWSVPLPPIPTTPLSVPIPGFPDLGVIGVLTIFHTGDGIVCWDFDVVDTGPQPPIANGDFEAGFGADADGWIEADYAPSDFAAFGDVDVGTRPPDVKGCSLSSYDDGADFRTFAARTASASFSGEAAMELRASVDCGGAGFGQFRWRASAEIPDVDIPSNATHVTFWARMAGGVACGTAESCFPFTCRWENYDAQNLIGLLFDDQTATPTARTRVPVEFHGTDVGFCSAHLTETTSDASHHPFFDSPASSALGSDGRMWYRYTVGIPESYRGVTVRLGVLVDHFQNWSGTGGTGVYVDQIYLSDAGGNSL